MPQGQHIYSRIARNNYMAPSFRIVELRGANLFFCDVRHFTVLRLPTGYETHRTTIAFTANSITISHVVTIAVPLQLQAYIPAREFSHGELLLSVHPNRQG